MIEFNAKKMTKKVIDWIRWYFSKNGDENTVAVVGVSGGKDSSVVLKLCTEALGADRVVAVLLPRGKQDDIRYAYTACTVCGIPDTNVYEINIEDICNAFANTVAPYAVRSSTQRVDCTLISRIRICVTLLGRLFLFVVQRLSTLHMICSPLLRRCRLTLV